MPIIDFSTEPPSGLSKLKEAVLYIAKKSEGDPRFGALKLNKILFYADFQAYRALGQSIIGATYQHLEQGPAPKELLPAKRALGSDFIEEPRPYLNRIQKRIVALREADESVFHPDEIRILDQVIGDLWLLNGSEVSDLSHAEWGWRLTEVGETIPYESAWLSSEPLSQEQIATGMDLWKSRKPS